MASQTLKRILRPYQSMAEVRDRIKNLEDEIQECRKLNLRLAELCDVMMEMLLPAAERDEKEIGAILERYRSGVSDPIAWRSER
jgi:hypothetical protein